jgi:hypothetical protein
MAEIAHNRHSGLDPESRAGCENAFWPSGGLLMDSGFRRNDVILHF